MVRLWGHYELGPITGVTKPRGLIFSTIRSDMEVEMKRLIDLYKWMFDEVHFPTHLGLKYSPDKKSFFQERDGEWHKIEDSETFNAVETPFFSYTNYSPRQHFLLRGSGDPWGWGVRLS